MSVTEIDIYRAANIFIDKHGNAALLEAMKKEEALYTNGDIKGSRVWHRITNAIEWMQMPENLKSETIQ